MAGKPQVKESSEELKQKLTMYKEQLEQIEEALSQDRNNENLIKIRTYLLDVIKMTEDLYELSKSAIRKDQKPSFSVDNLLHIGQKCMALYEGDGLLYEAVIEALPTEENPKYLVNFEGYNSKSYVGLDQVTPLHIPQTKEEDEDEDEDLESSKKDITIPKNLKILPTDSEQVRNMKKRKIKAIKSVQRIQKLDEEKESGKRAWQSFTKKVSTKPKIGFLTGSRKESIFKSPDSVDGRVGVTGSGKGLTESPSFNAVALKRQKLD